MKSILRFLKRDSRNRELTEEVEAHIAERVDDLIEAGMPEREARQKALREFGNVPLTVERSREVWAWTSLDRLVQDVRFAIRTLWRNLGFTTAAVVCLALGIGANTAIFSLLDATLLRLLPVKEPSRLVAARGPRTLAYPQFDFLRQHARTMQFAAYSQVSLNLSAGEITDSATGQVVSDNYFSVLGVRPLLGRTISPGDEAVAVITHRFWSRRFGGDSGIVGSTVMLNSLPFTIIGVTPPRFFGFEVGTYPDIFVPLPMRDRLIPGPLRLPQPNSFWLVGFGRLEPGIDLQQAGAEASVLFTQANTEVSENLTNQNLKGFLRKMTITLMPAERGLGRLRTEFEKPLSILMVAVGVVLLIACANVAALLLARAAARQKEIGIRISLGAGRLRILRQLLTESLLLSVTGGLIGLLLSNWSATTLVGFLDETYIDVTLDARVLGFTLAVSVVTGLLFGFAPATLATRHGVASVLKGGTPATTLIGRRFDLRSLLVSGQVVLSFLLLIGAGLFIRTLANLKSLDIGFRADNVLLVSLNPALNRYSPERVGAFYDQLLERAGSLADVRTASLADQPLLGGAYIDGIAVEGRPSVNSNNSGVAIKLVSPRFFETMEIAIRLGRDFVPEDRRDSPKVAIVNQAFVGEFLAGTNPLGKRIGIGLPADMEIVGVISDTKYRDLRGPVPSTVYVPLSQSKMPQPQRWLHLRTSGDLQIVSTTIREQVRELDKDLPITKISSTSALIDQQLVTQRLIAGLSGVFAGLALLLASIGLYGVLAYNVERRTREIGIRMSLGAARGAVMWSMMRHCLRTAAAGIMIGLPLSFWLTRFVRAQLYGVEPGDAATVVVATLSLLVVAAIAGFLPARRASRVDPTVALRHD